MKNGERIETARTDLATLLGNLASRLRNDGLSLMGRAFMDSKPGDQDFRDAERLWASLEDAAAMLDAVKTQLCPRCRLLGVSEKVTFGRMLKSRRVPHRKKTKAQAP